MPQAGAVGPEASVAGSDGPVAVRLARHRLGRATRAAWRLRESLAFYALVAAYAAVWTWTKRAQLLSTEHVAFHWVREGLYWEAVANPPMRDLYTDVYRALQPPLYAWISTVVVTTGGTGWLNAFWTSFATYGTAVGLFLCGRRLSGNATGLVAAFLFLRSFDATQATMGASAHASMYVVFLAWFFFATRRAWSALVLVPAVGLFLFPPLGLVTGVLTGGLALKERDEVLRWLGGTSRVRLAVVLAVAAASVVGTLVLYLDHPLGAENAETRERYVEERWQGARFHERVLADLKNNVVELFDVRDPATSSYHAVPAWVRSEGLAVLTVAVAAAFALSWRRTSGLLVYVAAASVLLYVAADLLMPKLYLPSRMVRATLPMVTALFVAHHLVAGAERILAPRWRRPLVTAGLAFLLLVGSVGAGMHAQLKLVQPGSEACRILGDTPADAYVAYDASYYLAMVPACSARRPLYVEDAHGSPQFLAIDEFRDRRDVHLDLFASEGLHDALATARAYGVTHVVVGRLADTETVTEDAFRRRLVAEGWQDGRLVGCVEEEVYVLDLRPVPDVPAEPSGRCDPAHLDRVVE